MKAGGRIQAAIEVLGQIIERHQPVSIALADWGKSHRFAGSQDRNAIGHIVYDAMRRRLSIAWAMGADTPRALAIGAASGALALSAEEVASACDGEGHAPPPLSADEIAGLTRPIDEAPAHVQADVPEWLWPSFVTSFGSRAVEEGRAMTGRAPADLRVNTLKSSRDRVLKALADYKAEPGRWAPTAVRVPPPTGPQRTPNLTAEAAYQAGWVEVQDEGSQIAALLAGGGPRLQILDLCAGAGGKTLALAAEMQNTGQIYAYDLDRNRLKPIFERVKRAGVRNVQILRGGDEAALLALGPRFDLVLIDAPCTGTGVWRRRPEAKWRIRPESLVDRQAEQRAVLQTAKSLVKPGGRIAYITCSILPEENTGQVAAFVADNPGFQVVPYTDVWRQKLGTEPPASADGNSETLLLTPASHATDGFFVALIEAP